jgi:integrase/recombinase XerD
MSENFRSCKLIVDYLNYLTVIKGRSKHTIEEYRIDLLMLFSYIANIRDEKALLEEINGFSFVNVEFIKSISLSDMYSFISYCQTDRKCSAPTRSRKIVSIRQFWKYLKTKVRLIDNNITEELETPKMPKRIPKYLNLEQSVRLLIQTENSIRNHCIITIFLNCALRLSELVGINVIQIEGDILTIVGKGDKERKIFLTPASKNAISNWLKVRQSYNPVCDALFITKFGTRISNRSVQDMIKKNIKAAGLDSTKISTHKLRHTAATLMYKYGRVDIRSLQQILGHESIATTEIYCHIDESQLQSAVNSNPLASMFGRQFL